MALLLGFATLAMAVGDVSASARADDGSPAQGSWLTAVKRINQTGQDFTAVVSLTAGGVWLGNGFGVIVWMGELPTAVRQLAAP